MTVETPVRRSPGAKPPGPLHRVSGWAMRHAGLAVLLWVVVLAAVTATATVVGANYKNDNSLPGTDSQRVTDIFQAHQPKGDTASVQIVVQADGGLDADKSRMASMLAVVRTLPHVASVADPFTAPGSMSTDRRTAYSTVSLDVAATDMPVEDVRTIIHRAQDFARPGFQVDVGGDLARNAADSSGGASEGAGILAALVILVFVFGSLLAATLPLLTAVFAVGSTVALLMLASHLFTVPEYTTPVMMLVGLGVGIDYALLIFSRYRHELLKGTADPKMVALDTAGRSVLFAGCTVVIALLGLLALGLGSLQGVALGVTLTVLMTMLAAVTLLPALLTLFGKRIERSVRKHAAKQRRTPGDGWRKLAGLVQRGPWVPLLLGTVALVALSLPALNMRLGFADAGTDDPAKTSRKAYDLLADGFGPGFNGPLVVVSEGDKTAAQVLGQTLAADPGIAAVTPPQLTPDGKVATVLAFPKSAPQDAATSDLVQRLRDDTLPKLESQTRGTYLVGGATAAADDFASAVSKRLPIFVLVVVGLSALLLMAVFRSVLIPLKAAVLNLLSIGASLGVITLVFQQGWFGAQAGPIEAFVPVMIFAIVFGLSMDYEVFLVSRIHEEWRRTQDARAAVREGLATTGSVITAAAAIMIVVFAAFLLSPDRMLKQFGLGLATAVLLDALLIRCIIVPAVLRLMGNRAWWLPRWLDRALPKIALEKD
ncbi:MMPL family transporter [Kribbella jiaozuonensis]|uniref:MMPL family transporter n=1 Tax=Kribbella jiaozuonensis TaxID=2575441 RepID=A0A4U3LTB9_9ACTN|nr:MMPL family transporter [Kribbella jiaozuonensis]TKK77747.1 MMPL family transporter [Kribbella jiaozuonensis]